MTRIGFGFDTHRLESGYPLLLGGIKISHDKGSVGHSDGDTLIHAIIDALLGAAGLPDIGTWFPDTSATFKGIDSKKLLEQTMRLIREKGFRIGNIDTTIVIQSPKLSTYIPEIVRTLADLLDTKPECISVKAKTGEKIGFIGREEGLSAYAVVLLEGRT